MSLGYIKEAMYQFSDLYPPFLREVLVVFNIMDAPRIYQGSYVSIFRLSTFLESGQTPGFSRASSNESKRILDVPERSLGGF
jgi:hypothetical protein